MNARDRARIASELQQRLVYPYRWPGRQSDAMDKATRFIYHTERFADVLKTLATYQRRPDYTDFFNYTLNRWYNFWSSQIVESLFCSLPGVRAAPRYDKYVDFFIHDIPFDHKTTVFPAHYASLDDALAAPQQFAVWLYQNQSQERRFHTHNRLFLVLYADDGEHWKLKADVNLLGAVIEEYVVDFNPTMLIPCEIGRATAMADILWAADGGSSRKIYQRQQLDKVWARADAGR